MGVIARQSIRGALANYLGVAIGFVTTFFVLTDCLTQEEIGLTRVMVDAAMLFSGLAQLGTNASIVRFFPYFKDEERNHGIFGWSVLIPFVGFVLLTACFFIFKEPIMATYAEKSPLMADYFYLLLPLTFFALYMTVFETNASVLLKITVPKVVREVGIRVFNLGCYLLYGKGVITLDAFVLLFCSSYGLAMLLNFCYLLTLGKISFRIDFKFLDRKMMRELLMYTLFMTLTVLAGNIPLINSLFLGAKAGLALTGVYTIAFFIANVVEVPYRSLGAISRPLVAQAVKGDDWGEVNRLCKQVSLHQFLVSMMVLFFIWINLEALFRLIPHGSEYAGGMTVVLILGLAKVANSTLSIGTDVLNYSKKYPYALAFIGVLTASAIVFNQQLIAVWSIDGAACATLFSYALYFVLLLGYIGWRLRVNILSWGQLKVVALTGVLWAMNWVWVRFATPLFGSGMGGVVADAAAKTLLLMAAATGLIYWMKISSEINNIIKKSFARFSNDRGRDA